MLLTIAGMTSAGLWVLDWTECDTGITGCAGQRSILHLDPEL